MSFRRMHDHPRRLVDGRQMLVFEENFKRDILRFRTFARRVGQMHLDPFAQANAIGRFLATAVDRDAF